GVRRRREAEGLRLGLRRPAVPRVDRVLSCRRGEVPGAGTVARPAGAAAGGARPAAPGARRADGRAERVRQPRELRAGGRGGPAGRAAPDDSHAKEERPMTRGLARWAGLVAVAAGMAAIY